MYKIYLNRSSRKNIRIQQVGERGLQGDTGPQGPQGVQGETGATGAGVAAGGTTGQYLVKSSNADYATQWMDAPSTTWGDIEGDILDQEDLALVLDEKEDAITPGTTLQYYRGDKTFQTLNTSVVPESGNLYYTQARFDAALALKTTTDLAEGSNLYFTNTRADARITLQKGAANGIATLGPDGLVPADQLPADAVLSVNGQTGTVLITTTDISEGSNLYYTQARFNSAFSAKSTSDLLEGSNLYFTDERVDDRVALLIQNGVGISWSYNDGANTLTPTVSLSSFSTTNLSEGSNLYFTDERAQDAIGTILTDSSTIDFTYNDGAGTITASVIASGIDHNSLSNLATGDVHTQYALLAGRSGGQIIIGGTASGNNLTLQSTSNATRGKILFGTSGYDEVNNRLGVGNSAPTVPLDVTGNALISGNLGLGISPSNKLSVSGNADVVGNLGLGTTGPHSKLDVRGAFSVPISNKTADYTITNADHTITVDATSTNITITLPTASGITGRIYQIKKIDSSANTVTIDGNGSQTIDGDLTKILTTQWACITIQSNGSNWYII